MRTALALALTTCLLTSPLTAQKSDLQKSVELFAKDLKSRDATTRAEAAASLGQLPIEEVVPYLITALSDREASVREAAAGALWDAAKVAKPAIPALRTALGDQSPAVVIRAAGALISMDVSPSSIADPLRRVLKEGDGTDRFLAARALIGVEDPGTLATPILEYMQQNTIPWKGKDDSFARTRNVDAGKKALKSLSASQDPKLVAPLMEGMRKSPHLGGSILAALGEVKPRPDGWIDTLLGYAALPNAEVRKTAVDILGTEKKPSDVKLWVPAVARLAGDPQRDVRYAAMRSVGGVGGLAIDSLDPILQALQKDSEKDLRELAAETIGLIADSSFPIDPALKTNAAQKALPVLLTALEKDAHPKVRANVLKTIHRLQLDPAAASEILAKAAVEQKNREVRLEALYALDRRGRSAAAMESRIAPLLNDPDKWIRDEAKEVLEAMKSERSSQNAVIAVTTGDPAVRARALETLREYQHEFTEEAWFLSLNDMELEIATAFLDAGMSPNHRFANSSGNPALRVALGASEVCDANVRPAADDAKKLVRLLLDRGADPNIADENGNTPLMTAVQTCDPAIVKMLIAAKADLNKKNSAGLTAFEFGMWSATDGAAAVASAGYRLPAEKSKMYREHYKDDPKILELLKKATPAAKK